VTDAVPGIAYRFSDPALLRQALTHKSHGPAHYERLEFLGDSILNFVVSTRLFELHPNAPEGDLSRMRARIVRGRTLTEVAQGIKLGQQLKLGPGEMRSGGHGRSSILADALEALLGAIYLDGGYAACREVILALCDPLIRGLPAANELKDAKTRLQEWLQARGRPLPVYLLVGEEGADHAKRFHVECRLQDQDGAVRASGASRQRAEQAAAASLLLELAGSPEAPARD
jgi:ribonuclease III